MTGRSRIIYFTPQPDITAYELAIFVGIIGGVNSPASQGILIPDHLWIEMGDSLRRHWSLE
ncbi:MAG: hypothetical protein ACHQWH_02480 [Nitrososphaerales archaeon]|jgi:hypothetical protein